MKRRLAFTLIEIMIVVAIIGFLAMIAVPAFMKSRGEAQRSVCINNLRVIDAAKDEIVLESGGTNGVWMTFNNIKAYVKNGGSNIYCPLAAKSARSYTNYLVGRVGYSPECTFNIANPSLRHSLTNK